jgi:hypothetical protein
MPRIRILDGFDLYGISGVFHQRGVNAAFLVARLLDRVQLRPQEIRAQEIVRDPQPAGRVAL